jgi:hypothetical protein
MKLHNAHVRLADGREGVVVASGLDGLTVIVDGRIVQAANSTVTVIPAPAAPDLPPPQRTAQRPIQTSHEEPPRVQVIANPYGLPVLVDGRWSAPQ